MTWRVLAVEPPWRLSKMIDYICYGLLGMASVMFIMTMREIGKRDDKRIIIGLLACMILLLAAIALKLTVMPIIGV